MSEQLSPMTISPIITDDHGSNVKAFHTLLNKYFNVRAVITDDHGSNVKSISYFTQQIF